MLHDCIIIGAGPGGLQAAIYLGRYNRRVLLIDRTGGRTSHARFIENFLTQKSIAGSEIIERGLEQARGFNVEILRGLVTAVTKTDSFEVLTQRNGIYRSRYIIVSSGIVDNYPPIENLYQYLGTSFFTCVDCDGYRTTGRNLLVMGDSINTVRLAFGMKEMYTKKIILNLISYDPPPDVKEMLEDEIIPLIKGTPVRIIGGGHMEAVQLKDGSRIPCEMVIADFGSRLNDAFLAELSPKQDASHRYVVSSSYESSVRNLFIVGPLNTGNDQVVIAAGEGAVAAIEINKRLLDL